jgi:hypothetical protein
MSALTSRLKKLERSRRGDCPVCKNGSVIRYRMKGRDDLGPPPPPCVVCGRSACVVLVEYVVTTREEAQAALAAMKEQDNG